MNTSPPKSVRRVLIASPQPFYEDRGTPIAVGQLAAALTKLDFEVDLLVYPIGQDVQMRGLRTLRCRNLFGIKSVPVGFSLRKLLLDLSLTLELRKLLARTRYDIVQAVEEAILPAIVFCRGRGIRVIYDMQSSIPDQLRSHAIFGVRAIQSVLSRFERWALDRSDATICSAGLLAHVRRRSPRTRVIEWRFAGQGRGENSESPEHVRERLQLAPTERVVMYSGTFERYQGLEYLIGAIPAVLNLVPDAVFVLIGATSKQELTNFATVRNLVSRRKLLILPRLPRAAVPAYLSAADVLVSPRAYGDNIPLKIFDYMLSGKPIIATDLHAHRSILNDDTALFVGLTALSIAEGIVRVLQQDELASQLSRAALEAAGDYPGGEIHLELVRRLYRDVLDGGGAVASSAA